MSINKLGFNKTWTHPPPNIKQNSFGIRILVSVAPKPSQKTCNNRKHEIKDFHITFVMCLCTLLKKMNWSPNEKTENVWHAGGKKEGIKNKIKLVIKKNYSTNLCQHGHLAIWNSNYLFTP